MNASTFHKSVRLLFGNWTTGSAAHTNEAELGFKVFNVPNPSLSNKILIITPSHLTLQILNWEGNCNGNFRAGHQLSKFSIFAISLSPFLKMRQYLKFGLDRFHSNYFLSAPQDETSFNNTCVCCGIPVSVRVLSCCSVSSFLSIFLCDTVFHTHFSLFLDLFLLFYLLLFHFFPFFLVSLLHSLLIIYLLPLISFVCLLH